MVAVDDPDPPQEAKLNELSPDNEAHAKCFGVFPFMNIMATPVSEQDAAPRASLALAASVASGFLALALTVALT